MVENKIDKPNTPEATKAALSSKEIHERRVVLPVGGWTPEEVRQALETYKKAKTQFEKSKAENEKIQKELEEKKMADKDLENSQNELPPYNTEKKVTTYEIKSSTEGSPNVTYNVLPGDKVPANAINIKNPPTEIPQTQEEIDLHKKEEIEKKEIIEALKQKHEKEIDKVLGEFDFATLSSDEKKTIHAEALSEWVSVEKLTDEDKIEALKWTSLDGKIDITKLTEKQLKIVQQHKAKEYLEALKSSPDENLDVLEQKNPGIKNFIQEASRLHPLWKNDSLGNPNRLFDEEKFFEATKQDPSLLSETIKSIKENGFLLSGIQPEGKLGQALASVINNNVNEYLEINNPRTDLVDLDNFMWLKDVLGWSYNDLLFSKNFLLWENHKLKHTRDVLTQLVQDEIAQIPVPEAGDAEGTQKYQEEVVNAISSNTGASGDVAEKVMWQISRWNLSPFVRFLADLFAPLGSLFGWEVWDFWRNYLHENGMANGEASWYPWENWSVSSSPHGWSYIEGAHWSDIISNALKYKWITESNDWALIREMHKSGWLDAGPGAAWCMSFVQHVLRKDMGYTDAQIGTGKTAWAADGTKMGKHVDKKDIQPGDIALVKWAWKSGYHIGFVASMNQAAGTYELLWGNQGNAVTTRTEKIASAREFRGFEQRTESAQPNPQVSDWKEAAGNTDITKKALEWQKAWDIHGAIHCTDWVNKVYQETTWKSVYDSKTYYNWVKNIWTWTGIWGNHAPAEQIASIKEGQHLIIDHGNNGWKTHSVIALWTPDSTWRVQVVSYPAWNKPPKVEWYTLWTNTSAWEKRVLRIQWV